MAPRKYVCVEDGQHWIRPIRKQTTRRLNTNPSEIAAVLIRRHITYVRRWGEIGPRRSADCHPSILQAIAIADRKANMSYPPIPRAVAARRLTSPRWKIK